jgi:predicted nucleic acid-binding protein
MKIFLDANILVTVLCNEYPRFTACARVLSLCDDRRFQVYTSPLCLAIAAYFSEKKNGRTLARKKITLLAEKLRFTALDEDMTRKAVQDRRVTDIEDGLEYYSAVAAACTCVITYDKRDFHFAEVPVLDAEEFLLKHAVKRN